MGQFRIIGERLRKLRGNLSQEEFAKKLGISVRGYQNYEAGERIPKGKILSKIAVACNVTTDFVLTGEGFVFLLDKISDAISSQMGVDRIKESERPRYSLRSDIADKIMNLLGEMDEEARRDVLKYVEKEKLLADLKRERKKEDC